MQAGETAFYGEEPCLGSAIFLLLPSLPVSLSLASLNPQRRPCQRTARCCAAQEANGILPPSWIFFPPLSPN